MNEEELSELQKEKLQEIERQNRIKQGFYPEDTPTPSSQTQPTEQVQPIEETQPTEQVQPTEEIQPQEEEEEGLESLPTPKAQAKRQLGLDLPGGRTPIVSDVVDIANIPGYALADFTFDAISNASGIEALERLDDSWDEWSKFDNPYIQKAREMTSVILPTIIAIKTGNAQLAKAQLPGLAHGLSAIGMTAAIDGAVISLSDEGEDHNVLYYLNEWFPHLNIPEEWRTLESDSPKVRQEKNRWESIGLSVVADILGYGLIAGKPIMGWFKGLDNTAKTYKAKSLLDSADNDTLMRISQIDEALSSGAVGKADQSQLMQERQTLLEQLNSGTTSATRIQPLEASIQRNGTTRNNQTDEIALSKIEADPTSSRYDPDIYSKVSSEASTARQSIPTANVARNMADTTAIKRGTSQGDPAPLISDPMLRKGLHVSGNSRQTIVDLAEQARNTGNFNATVDGFRFTAKEMNAAAWDIYRSIINANTVQDVRKLFLRNRDVKNLIDGTKIDYINDVNAQAAAFAIRDLTDKYLGRAVTLTSARAMDTLGREMTTISNASKDFSQLMDKDRIMTSIMDKWSFLTNEYALNKYISGWQLRNKGWWNNLTRFDNPKEFTDLLQKEFTEAQNALHAKTMDFRQTLEELRIKNPLAMKPLVDAFALSNGDVDTLMKLQQWAWKKITPLGLIKSPTKEGMNLFAKGLWAIRYNNVLSGISAFRAGLGNTSALMLRSMNSFLGHGVEALLGNSFEPIKKAIYYQGAMFETNKRALYDAWEIIKKVNTDPDAMVDAFRKDFIIQDDNSWEVLENLSKSWTEQADYGKIFFYRWAKVNRDIARWPIMRSPLTAMTGIDAFTNTKIATEISRVKAYDEVFKKNGGNITLEALERAEKQHYKNIFNLDGTVKDSVVKTLSGGIAMNLDDGAAKWIQHGVDRFPFLKSFFMFPRTGNNLVKYATSYTPLMAIPGLSRYTKILWAGNDIEKIKVALAEHGIKDFNAEPAAMAIYQNLRAEYRGRLAFATLLSGTLFDYALGGNIRGNGPPGAADRRKLRDNYGWKPRTINVGGTWYDYSGIPGVEAALTLVGDAAYYASDIGSSIMEDLTYKLAWTFTATFLDQTALSGIDPILKALTGDETALRRIAANEVRGLIPASGALGVVSQAITTSQKSIHNDFLGYIKNRIPIASSTLPEQRDFWTGKPINEIDNPILRGLNALSPVKVSDGEEPFRKYLRELGFPGVAMLLSDSTGSREYTPEERDLLYQYIGELQPYLEVQELMKSKRYNNEIGQIRTLRAQGHDADKIKLEQSKLPVYKEIRRIIKRAQILAEQRLRAEQPDIWGGIDSKKVIDNYLEQGRVEDANKVSEQQKLKTILQLRK
tara:strand:+ start:8552 stop:12643 length:4092 start_codon:yes stop_codon:yes gene_type:complete